ncbi:uncharacterized protein LOC123313835 [Coccinella septempunctata]|uniref:uncharacterized protein LOC123313835 n=1 Tax=Coccinella septempunctata TaxID=41139 RepID=UPI001D06FCAD|nr:uncharacterized protein LOC123313835 [Coccinella septempunctata]XP_044754821.1 uncharacterized protein LOC123313835 [Coccinella septempunctata]
MMECEPYNFKAVEGGFNVVDLVWLHNPHLKIGLSPVSNRRTAKDHTRRYKGSTMCTLSKNYPGEKKPEVHLNRLAKYDANYDEHDETNLRRTTTQKVDPDEMIFD